MNRRALLAAAALALARPPSGAPAGTPVSTPTEERTTDFLARSRLRYPGESEAVNELESVYVHPDRVRWSRRLVGGRPGDRDVQYRRGEGAWILRRGQGTSEEVPSEARDALFRLMELRRAVLRYPEDLAWSDADAGRRRTAELPRTRGAGAPDAGTLGRLVAELGDDGRLRTIRSFDADGAERDGVEVLEPADGGGVPRRLRFFLGPTTTWTEEVLELSTRIRFVDDFFVPPDRRPQKRMLANSKPIHPLDIVPQTVLAEPIAGRGREPDWAALIASFAMRRAVLAEDLGRELDPAPTFRLDRDGRPVATLFRLNEPRDPPPAGWTSFPERPGLALLAVPGFAELRREHVDVLLRAAGTDAGAPYARAGAADGTGRIQVILPLEPSPERR